MNSENLNQQELTEILQTSRQALADVRTVARGYRQMSLADEAKTAHTMLATTGINTTIRIDPTPLPTETDTVLATVDGHDPERVLMVGLQSGRCVREIVGGRIGVAEVAQAHAADIRDGWVAERHSRLARPTAAASAASNSIGGSSYSPRLIR